MLESYEDPDIPFLWFHSFGEAFVRPWPAPLPMLLVSMMHCAQKGNTNGEGLCCCWL